MWSAGGFRVRHEASERDKAKSFGQTVVKGPAGRRERGSHWLARRRSEGSAAAGGSAASRASQGLAGPGHNTPEAARKGWTGQNCRCSQVPFGSFPLESCPLGGFSQRRVPSLLTGPQSPNICRRGWSWRSRGMKTTGRHDKTEMMRNAMQTRDGRGGEKKGKKMKINKNRKNANNSNRKRRLNARRTSRKKEVSFLLISASCRLSAGGSRLGVVVFSEVQQCRGAEVQRAINHSRCFPNGRRTRPGKKRGR